MGVDQDIVSGYVGQVRGDVPDATHIGGELIDLVDAAARRLQAVVPPPQIEQLEFIRGRGFVFGFFDIDAADPMAVFL